jgi:hypothetical protein
MSTHRTPPQRSGKPTDLAERHCPSCGWRGLVDPIFVSVKEAARLLNLNRESVYRRCDQLLIQSQYEGRRRLVRYDSVLSYADNLPFERPEAS